MIYINADSVPSSVLSLVHTESAEDASTVEITYGGYKSVDYLEEVTLERNSTVVFHGKITAFSHSNDEGKTTTRITATDFIWLLDHQALGSQVQATGLDGYSIRAAANASLLSWEMLAPYIRVVAPGWVAASLGCYAAPTDNVISVDISRAGDAVAAVVDEETYWLSSWDALLKMQSANPNALMHARPDGKLEIIALEQTPILDLDISQILSASDISPRDEQIYDGVAVFVSWTFKNSQEVDPNGYWRPDSDEIPEGIPGRWVPGGFLISEPPDLDISQSNIKLFSAGVQFKHQAIEQAAYMWSQIRAYYLGRKARQWGGTVTLDADSFGSSPLCQRVNIHGAEAHPSWATMQAIVTEVSWDYSLPRKVTLTLGKSLTDPEIREISYDTYERQESSSDDDSSSSSGWHLATGSIPPGGGGGDPGGGGEGWSYSRRTSSQSESEQTEHTREVCDCPPKWASLEVAFNELVDQFNALYKDYHEHKDLADQRFNYLLSLHCYIPEPFDPQPTPSPTPPGHHWHVPSAPTCGG